MAAVVAVLVVAALLLDPRPPPVHVDRGGQPWLAQSTESAGGPDVELLHDLAGAPYGPPSGPVSANYRRDAFTRDLHSSLCASFTATALAEADRLPGIETWILPTANHTRGIRSRCFSTAAGARPSAGDSMCERDLLGLPWPVTSEAAIKAARGAEPVSIATPPPADTLVDADGVTLLSEAAVKMRRRKRAPRLPYALTTIPDYFASREYLERHRFWRTVGRAGQAESERPKLFVDVGANGGFHSFVAALYGFDVLALEPIPAAATALREGICLNSYVYARITVANFTAGMAEGVCELPAPNQPADPACYSTLSLPSAMLRTPLGAEAPLQVRHRTIDSLKLPYVTAVKVDAGHRTMAVLFGMRETLRTGGVGDASAVVDDRGASAAAGDEAGANEAGAQQRFPVTVALIRVPLDLVPECVAFLWAQGMAVFWRDLDRGTLDTEAAVADALRRARASGADATGMNLYARPRERVDVLDHAAALRGTALATVDEAAFSEHL